MLRTIDLIEVEVLQETVESRQQTPDRRQKTADSRRQTADSREQKADTRDVELRGVCVLVAHVPIVGCDDALNSNNNDAME
jgi:hypothetical protein